MNTKLAIKPTFAGVDDGHYAIKIITEDGGMFSVPSRAKEGRHLISLGSEDDGGGFYTTNDGKTFTANEHLQQFQDTRSRDFPTSALNRVLVHHGLRQAALGDKDVVITTGLPFSYYYLANGEKNRQLISAKCENMRKPITCGSSPVATIVKNTVTTEAIAAYIDQLMDMQGKPTPKYGELRESMVGMIDIGGKTTDSVVILPAGVGPDGKQVVEPTIDNQRSGSIDVGVLKLNDAVEAKLRSMFELDNCPPRMIEQAIRKGTVRIERQDKDVSDMVTHEKERLTEQIMAGVRAKFGSGKDLDWVFFVGGGAIVLRDQLEKYFANCEFPEYPEYANARGMFKIAKYVFGAGGSVGQA
jgi:plasmid segregation protein ParM